MSKDKIHTMTIHHEFGCAVYAFSTKEKRQDFMVQWAKSWSEFHELKTENMTDDEIVIQYKEHMERAETITFKSSELDPGFISPCPSPNLAFTIESELDYLDLVDSES